MLELPKDFPFTFDLIVATMDKCKDDHTRRRSDFRQDEGWACVPRTTVLVINLPTRAES